MAEPCCRCSTRTAPGPAGRGRARRAGDRIGRAHRRRWRGGGAGETCRTWCRARSSRACGASKSPRSSRIASPARRPVQARRPIRVSKVTAFNGLASDVAAAINVVISSRRIQVGRGTRVPDRQRGRGAPRSSGREPTSGERSGARRQAVWRPRWELASAGSRAQVSARSVVQHCAPPSSAKATNWHEEGTLALELEAEADA